MLRAKRVKAGPTTRRLRAIVLAIGLAAACPGAAQAQFNFFGLGDASVQDVYDSIAENGFRLAGPLTRNGSVWVADVYDRRHRRERLIVSARDATIVQRFFVEVGPGRGSPYAAPPAEAPDRLARRPRDDDFFSRITRGFSDDSAPRPPAGIGETDPDGVPAAPPRAVVTPRARQKPLDVEPRLATRKDEGPITAAPLPAPSPLPVPSATPATPAAPAVASRPTAVPVAPVQPTPTPAAPAAVASKPPTPVASTPASAVPSATGSRPVVVVTDPLRIPGHDAAPAEKPLASAAKDGAKPAGKPASGDVPVAPLD